MWYRPLGETGSIVSAIGLGLAALGRPGYLTLDHGDDLAGATDPVGLGLHTNRVLDAALAAGITYFDAARSYGRAEEYLAHWLRARRARPRDVVAGSKWGYVYTADWQTDADVHEVKIHSLENLDRQHHESETLLGDFLRLYQIHSATTESGVLDDHAIIERLGELRDTGLLIGITVSGVDQAETIRRALSIEAGGQPLFGAVQATWNLLERSAETALTEAAEAGLAVIVKEAVANGRLTSRDRSIGERLRGAAADWTVDAVAMAAALQQPWATVVLSGAASEQHLASNLEALSVPSEVVERLPMINEPPVRYWTIRSDLAWT